MIIGIFAISAATEVTYVQLGNKLPPPHIFDNNINDDDSTGTYIVTITTINTGGQILQL